MSKNNVKIILFLLAVILVGASYMYVFKPNMEDTDALKSEANTLETRLNELKEKDKNRDVYEAEIITYGEAVDEMVADFPATLDQEISVMFIKGCEEARNGEFEISSTGLGAPQQFYTLGGSADSEGNVTGGYSCFQSDMPISYTGTYDGVKEFVDYILGYKYRMSISSINIVYDESNEVYAGSVNMHAFCVSGEDREADTLNLNVETGVDNIFFGGEGAPSANTYAYDSDDGASIATDNDIKITLNNANNDATDGVVVSAGGSDTYVTYGDNDVAELVIKVYEEDGKNYVSYTIGSESYSMEVASKDVKVYVQSSERVDSDDDNGVKVTVDNDTTVPVFFKVDGDDVTSPRFTVGSKSGTVKVY